MQNDAWRMTHRFPAEHPCFAGHFPGNPLVPGVLLLALAESLAGAHGRSIARVLQAKFLQPLLPEQVCEVTLTPQQESRARMEIRAGSHSIVQGVVEFAAIP